MTDVGDTNTRADADDPRHELWQRKARHFESRVHFNKLCNLRVSQWDDRQVVMHLPHAEQLCNSTDGIHGGVVGALADTCGTAAALAATGADGFIATVSMNINYLAAATTDLTAVGVCVKPGKRIQVTEVSVTDANGRLVAKATITSSLPS